MPTLSDAAKALRVDTKPPTSTTQRSYSPLALAHLLPTLGQDHVVENHPNGARQLQESAEQDQRRTSAGDLVTKTNRYPLRNLLKGTCQLDRGSSWQMGLLELPPNQLYPSNTAHRETHGSSSCDPTCSPSAAQRAEDAKVDHSPPSQNTRSRRRLGAAGTNSRSSHLQRESRLQPRDDDDDDDNNALLLHDAPPQFDRFGGAPRSVRETNALIRQELLRRRTTKVGHLYGFTYGHHSPASLPLLPDDDASLPIKIGRSVDPRRRMHQLRARCCGRSSLRAAAPPPPPRLLFVSAAMPHHHRIEAVVHLVLHDVRLRLRRACAGCGARHAEWFRVGRARAEALVRLWQRFAAAAADGGRGLLYDEAGEPSLLLRRGLAAVELDDPDCWVGFVSHGLREVVAAAQVEEQDDAGCARELEGAEAVPPSSNGRLDPSSGVADDLCL